MLLEPVSMQYIAKEMGIDRKTVINILDDIPDAQRLKLPKFYALMNFTFLTLIIKLVSSPVSYQTLLKLK